MARDVKLTRSMSTVTLLGAWLQHIASTARSPRRYLNIELLKGQQMMRGAITALELGREPLQPNRKCERFWTVPPGNGPNSTVVQKRANSPKISA